MVRQRRTATLQDRIRELFRDDHPQQYDRATAAEILGTDDAGLAALISSGEIDFACETHGKYVCSCYAAAPSIPWRAVADVFSCRVTEWDQHMVEAALDGVATVPELVRRKRRVMVELPEWLAMAIETGARQGATIEEAIREIVQDAIEDDVLWPIVSGKEGKVSRELCDDVIMAAFRWPLPIETKAVQS